MSETLTGAWSRALVWGWLASWGRRRIERDGRGRVRVIGKREVDERCAIGGAIREAEAWTGAVRVVEVEGGKR